MTRSTQLNKYAREYLNEKSWECLVQVLGTQEGDLGNRGCYLEDLPSISPTLIENATTLFVVSLGLGHIVRPEFNLYDLNERYILDPVLRTRINELLTEKAVDR